MQNEGSIFKRTIIRNKKKYKYYVYQWMDEVGKKHNKSFPYTQLGKKEAENFQQEIMEKRKRGFLLASQDKTVGDWVSEYLLVYKKPKLRKSSYRRQLVSAVKLDPIADIALDKLTPTDVQQLYNDLAEKGLSTSSISNVHKLLSEAYRKAFANRIIISNPMLAVDAIKVKTTEINIFTYRQIRILFGTIRKLKKGVPSSKEDTFGKHFNVRHDYKLMFWMLLTTGMRISELLSLEWSDISFKDRTISITKSKVNENRNDVNAPKTVAGRRTIPIISEALFRRLKKHQERDGVTRITGPVFDSKSGKMLCYQNIYRVWSHIMNETGLKQPKGRAFHIFRHTFASFVLRKLSHIIPLVSLSRILGHSDVSTTLRIYQHHIPDDNERILSDLENIRNAYKKDDNETKAT